MHVLLGDRQKGEGSSSWKAPQNNQYMALFVCVCQPVDVGVSAYNVITEVNIQYTMHLFK
jgi:hypothetical protein